MYVIGINDYNLIKLIKIETNNDMLTVIKTIEYDITSVDEATVFPDIKIAKKFLEKIKNNVENIEFENENVFGQIFDKDNGFDKLSYAKELKLFELVPVLFNEDDV